MYIIASQLLILKKTTNQKNYLFYCCFFLIVASVGFEFEEYSVSESAGVVEVCVVVTNPPVDQPLSQTQVLSYSSQAGSAGNHIFTPSILMKH